MKRTAFLLALLLCLASCDNRSVRQVVKDIAEAPVDTTGFVSETMRVTSFTAIDVDCFADVTFHQVPIVSADDDMPTIKVAAPPSVLEHVNIRVSDGTLRISTDRRYRMPENAVIVTEIYAPFVNNVMLNGGKCFRMGTHRQNTPMTIEMSGNIGALTADTLVTPELSIKIEGDGTAELHGISTKRLNVELTGHGEINLEGESTKTLISKSGDGVVNTEKLTSAEPIEMGIL